MSEPLRIGIAGLGTVGVGVLSALSENGERISLRCGRTIEVAGVCARDRNKDRGVDVSGFAWHDDPVSLAQSNTIDVFVELIGGEEGPARASVEAALESGRHVVTANKALLAHHGNDLAARAEASGAVLNFEAAVAGGIPIVKAMREGLSANRIERVSGILNGTCNYILTTMEETGRGFADVLKEAQELGFAEADPTFDIGGHDSAHKLAILTALAFGTKISFDDVFIEGITNITAQDIRAADELGYRIKLLGVAQDTGHGIEQRVHPTLVPKSCPIADVDGVFNAVVVEGDQVGDLMIEGRGAGAGPTASAVVADLVDIARGQTGMALGMSVSALSPYVRARMRAHQGGYYVGLLAYDRPGAVAAIAQRMADQQISLDSIVQRGDAARSAADGPDGEAMLPVAMITHETQESAIRAALDGILADGHIAEPPHMIRIERM